MAQRPRPPSPQITWREVKSARRRPPLLRSRPGSPERPRRTTGAVRRRPRPTRTTCVSQCFSVQFFTFPVVSRPTRGLPVDGRRPRSQCFSEHFRVRDTTTGVAGRDPSGRLPSDPARSSGRRPHLQRSSQQFNVRHDYIGRAFRSSPVRREVVRSTAGLAALFRSF